MITKIKILVAACLLQPNSSPVPCTVENRSYSDWLGIQNKSIQFMCVAYQVVAD